MTAFRAFFLARRNMALAVIALALVMKAIIPAGYMLDQTARGGGKVLTVRICEDAADFGHVVVRDIHLGSKSAGKHERAGETCPFTALGMAGLSGVDPVLLASALAFVMALAFARRLLPAPRRTAYLRPPLRAPPVFG